MPTYTIRYEDEDRRDTFKLVVQPDGSSKFITIMRGFPDEQALIRSASIKKILESLRDGALVAQVKLKPCPVCNEAAVLAVVDSLPGPCPDCGQRKR